MAWLLVLVVQSRCPVFLSNEARLIRMSTRLRPGRQETSPPQSRSWPRQRQKKRRASFLRGAKSISMRSLNQQFVLEVDCTNTLSLVQQLPNRARLVTTLGQCAPICWNCCHTILASIFCITPMMRSSLSICSAMLFWASCASITTSMNSSLKLPSANCSSELFLA